MKELARKILKYFGKRVTNLHAPAKPYSDGVVFLSKFITKPAWIIDVGAADGTSDITNVYPLESNKYLLIDPAPNFADFLKKSVQKYPENVVAEMCFCGEKEGEVTLNINRTGHYSSRYVKTGLKETVTVPMKTLDQITNKHCVHGPVLLKIDVEGAELDVLRGATATLAICDVVIIETWINAPTIEGMGDFADIISFMKKEDFVVFDFFGGHTNSAGIVRHVDTVFVKNNSSYRALVFKTDI